MESGKNSSLRDIIDISRTNFFEDSFKMERNSKKINEENRLMRNLIHDQ